MISATPRKTFIKSIAPSTGEETVIATFDARQLHQYILQKVGIELSKLSTDCYYPNIIQLYNELLHKTGVDETQLKQYVTDNYPKEFGFVVRNPQNMLLILIAQDFIRRKDNAAALATINMLSLKMYQHLMYKYIKFCNPDYFRGVMGDLSRNHLFVQKQTIGQAILFLSKQVYSRYKDDLKADNHFRMGRMIQELRTRFNQSIKSFAKRYYEIAKNKEATRLTDEDMPQEENTKSKIERAAGLIARELTVYNNVDYDAAREAQTYSKFNRRLAVNYVKAMSSTNYTNDIDLLIKLYLSTIESASSKFDFVKHAKKLMSIKYTTKPVYFKKILIDLHRKITDELGLTNDFDKLSVQSKAVSRSFLAYYIAVVIFNHLHDS